MALFNEENYINSKASPMVEFSNSFSWTSYYHAPTELHEGS